MWVLKTRGESYYVHHVECTVPWNTKETVDNPHTKGSIKIKNALLEIDSDNCAKISNLSVFDRIRLKNKEKGITRILWTNSSFEKILKEEQIKHSPFKRVHGACATAYTVCDLLDEAQATILALKYPRQFRVLMPNEPQYRSYDDPKLWEELQKNEDLSEVYEDDDD
jgi:hypothetical protein